MADETVTVNGVEIAPETIIEAADEILVEKGSPLVRHTTVVDGVRFEDSGRADGRVDLITLEEGVVATATSLRNLRDEAEEALTDDFAEFVPSETFLVKPLEDVAYPSVRADLDVSPRDSGTLLGRVGCVDLDASDDMEIQYIVTEERAPTDYDGDRIRIGLRDTRDE